MSELRAPIVAQKPTPTPQSPAPVERDITPPETARHVLVPVEPDAEKLPE